MTTEKIHAACVALAQSMLSPEQFGHAVTAEVRDEARKALGRAPVEQAQYLNAAPAIDEQAAWTTAYQKLTRGSIGTRELWDEAIRIGKSLSTALVVGLDEIDPGYQFPADTTSYPTAYAALGEVFAHSRHTTCEPAAVPQQPAPAVGAENRLDEVTLIRLRGVMCLLDMENQSKYEPLAGHLFSLLATMRRNIEALKEKSSDAEMYARAWQRELAAFDGTIRNKRHHIDAMVLTTQDLVAAAKKSTVNRDAILEEAALYLDRETEKAREQFKALFAKDPEMRQEQFKPSSKAFAAGIRALQSQPRNAAIALQAGEQS